MSVFSVMVCLQFGQRAGSAQGGAQNTRVVLEKSNTVANSRRTPQTGAGGEAENHESTEARKRLLPPHHRSRRLRVEPREFSESVQRRPAGYGNRRCRYLQNGLRRKSRRA